MPSAKLAAVLAGALLVSIMSSLPVAAEVAPSTTAQTETAPLPLQQECAAVNIASSQLELAHLSDYVVTGANQQSRRSKLVVGAVARDSPRRLPCGTAPAQRFCSPPTD
jgi:hypothetical protein